MTASRSPRYLSPLMAAMVLLLPIASMAASTITFNNTGSPTANPPVPPLSIELTSDLLLNDQGNFTATCRKDSASDVYCSGIQSQTEPPPTGDAPVLTFTVSRDAVDLANADRSVTLTWSNNPAAEICVAAGSTNVTGQGWGGLWPVSGPQTITYSAVGTYDYTLACYNQFGKSQVITRRVEVTSSVPVPTDDCRVVKSQISDPFQRSLFQPDGFEQRLLSWNQLFGPGSIYPTAALSEPYPVGSYTLAGNVHSPAQTTRARYISVPIDGNGNNYKFEWIQAKPVAIYGYQPARPTDFKYVTISTCPGDFRITSAFSAADPVNDPTLIQQCRNQVVAETGINYGPTGFGRCRVESGKRYYLNIVFANPNDGLSPTETGCRDTFGGVCDTSWKHLLD